MCLFTQCVNILELRNPPCELPTRKAEYHSLNELEEIHLNLNLTALVTPCWEFRSYSVAFYHHSVLSYTRHGENIQHYN